LAQKVRFESIPKTLTDSKGHLGFVPRAVYFCKIDFFFAMSSIQSFLLILKDIPASFLEKRTLHNSFNLLTFPSSQPTFFFVFHS